MPRLTAAISAFALFGLTAAPASSQTTYLYTAPPPAVAPPAPSTVITAPVLDRDEIEDRVDHQGYDDVEVRELRGDVYGVTAEDKNDRKVWLWVDAATGSIRAIHYRE